MQFFAGPPNNVDFPTNSFKMFSVRVKVAKILVDDMWFAIK